ncbi:MAG: DEAD/DEAH box helicase [Bacteroidia bacterium]|nr:DEAD/DEAH box helicase [Bacteroidia bacterium]
MKKNSTSIIKSAKKRVPTQDKVSYHRKPTDMSLDDWQITLRRQFAEKQNFTVTNTGDHPVFSDYQVFNPESKSNYKVAIRSKDIGMNFCSCPDFRTNQLGTCKHIEYVLNEIKKNHRRLAILNKSADLAYSSLSLFYGKERKVRLRIGTHNKLKITQLAKNYFDSENFLKPETSEIIDTFINRVREFDPDFRCYQDAVDFIIDMRDTGYREQKTNELFPDGINSKAFETLIKTKLYSYQKDGVIFAAKAGRVLIADEMGLGKTIQAIATAEIMANYYGVEKILIICPTSLKYQWKSEIEKFTDRSVRVIEGMANRRQLDYFSGELYKIASYHAIRNDIRVINDFCPDLVILDEAQRIKNWKTKTAQGIKSIDTRYTIVLTGTPIENRLDELHSIIQFIDRYTLGPLFRFLDEHQVTDETGRVTGYKNLNSINRTLQSIMIRRTKKEIADQLPDRIDNNYFVPVTKPQMEIHDEYLEAVSRLIAKWKKLGFLPESDKQHLLICLNCMRMVSDSTYILDQKTRHDTKIEELMEFLSEVFERKEQKVVIFSQWERMTRLVSLELDNLKISYEYLHGGIPSTKRKSLLDNFNNNGSRVFLSTDAGGVGLNLQSASIVINLDIPWNPAVLEQRIARVHRLGQKNHVQVVNFISSGTIEHRILSLLGFKKAVFEGVLDNGDDNVFMGDSRFNKFMKAVESIVDESVEQPEIETSESEQEKTEPVPDFPFEEDEPVLEPIQDTLNAEKSDQTEYQTQPQLQDLFVSGLDFLQKLGTAVSGLSSGKSSISDFIEKDEKTGKSNLKIPLPNEDVIEKAVNALSLFIQAFTKK